MTGQINVPEQYAAVGIMSWRKKVNMSGSKRLAWTSHKAF